MAGLWVEESGPDDAPLVVFVHGSMDRSTSFSKVVRRLRDLHTVVYDRRGYAGSSDVGASVHGREPGRRPALRDAGAPGSRGGAQLRGQRRARCGAGSSRPRARGGRLRGAHAVGRLVAAHVGRVQHREAVARRRRPGRHLRAVHAPDDRRRAMGALARCDAGEPSRRGARPRRRDHRSREDSAVRRVGHRRCPSSPPAARTGRPITGSRPSSSSRRWPTRRW